jgi:glycosyltransferase involved in cell wall biosynthesis
MKILLLNDEFYTTGASTAMLSLAQRLAPHHELMVMPRIDGQGEVRKQFEAMGIPIVQNVTQVDLVIANTLMAGVHVAEAGIKCPVIWWIHEAETGRDMLLAHPQLAAGFKHAAAIVFQTPYQKIVYGSYLFDSKADVHVMPFWNTAIYAQPEIEPMPKTKKRLLTIGTVHVGKRMQDIIYAVELLDTELRDQIECVFIGKYLELEPRAKRFVDRNPERYVFLGEKANAEALRYMASADCFVIPSGSESQPLTIWEAFELGVPICVSDLDTYRHIGFRHGQHALMHPVGNTAVLSANLRMMLTDADLNAAIAKAGKSLLLRMMVNDWLESFDRLIQDVVTKEEIRKLGY